ncbi:MAG: GNAT family N-acetyltransferase, partial [Anaerococcus sp.]
EEKVWDITHTVVNPIYGGKGIAGELLDKVVDYAKENDIKLIPSCSYARKKFNENPEQYGDVRY